MEAIEGSKVLFRDGAHLFRRCASCHEIKPVADFTRNPGLAGGVNAYCKPCYSERTSKNRRSKAFESIDKVWDCDRTVVKIQHRAEIIFIQKFFDHKNWTYQPAIFNLGNAKYTPDFYDAERNIFIEVVGTRQAYHFNKEKYKQFVLKFPALKFEIRTPNGEFYKDHNGD